MRKFRFFSLFLTILALGFSISVVCAQSDLPPDEAEVSRKPAAARRPQILRELNLAPAQIRQIRRLNQERRPLMREAQLRFRQANRALDEAVYADAPNEALIRARLAEVQAAQAEIIKIRTAHEFAIRLVLTTEQLAKFRDLRQRFMRARDDFNDDIFQRPEQTIAPQFNRPLKNPNRPRRQKRGF